MKDIVIFAGTTEGRQLSEGLAMAGIPHTVCVATEYGEMLIREHSLVEIHKGRMDLDEMRDFINEKADIVFDATHPYAQIVTENIRMACAETNKEYIRIIRDEDEKISYANLESFDNIEECKKALASSDGNILLTTGSKDLYRLVDFDGASERIYARVLPSEESIRLCTESDIKGEHIIAMQGPFNVDLNKAIISQYNIQILVTKESGKAGGYNEKIKAAKEMGIKVFVIGRSSEEEGISVEEALRLQTGKEPKIKIGLIGIGPGARKHLTMEANEMIQKADMIFGAARMVENYWESKECYLYYLAKDVAPIIVEKKPKNVAILFSGDSGFFSGATKMKEGLEEALKKEGIDFDLRIVPGVSSVSYFSSLIGRAYSDGYITSLHGRSNDDAVMAKIIEGVKREGKVFTLLSGLQDVNALVETLLNNDCEKAHITLGYELSYPEERTIRIKVEYFKAAKELANLKEGLYVALIEE